MNLGFARQIFLAFVLNNSLIVDFIQCIVNIVTPSTAPPISTFLPSPPYSPSFEVPSPHCLVSTAQLLFVVGSTL